LPCPTAEAAWSSSIDVGRIGSSIRRIPRAIAPEVTSTTSSPAAWRFATSWQSASSTSVRSSPASSATMLEPSFTTTVAIYSPPPASFQSPSSFFRRSSCLMR
jgi:hypothetical protein